MLKERHLGKFQERKPLLYIFVRKGRILKKKNEFFKLVVRNLPSRVTQLIMSPSVTFSPNYFITFYLLFKSSSVLGEGTSGLISDPVAEVFVAYEPSFPKNNRWTSPLLYHAFGKSKISFRRRMS